VLGVLQVLVLIGAKGVPCSSSAEGAGWVLGVLQVLVLIGAEGCWC
jgi:NADH:ubiquinone oxidoreductase subunit 6 (subunit J)